LSSSRLKSNETFDATVVVQNIGKRSVDGGILGIWTDSPDPQACGAAPIRSLRIGELAPGASGKYNFTGLRPGEDGERVMRAVVDKDCQIFEENEQNNQRTQSYTVLPVPDLVITDIQLNPSQPPINTLFDATIEVKNQGKAAAPESLLSAWTNRKADVGCNTAAEAKTMVGPLPPGISQKVTVTGLLAGTLTRSVLAQIDADCKISEASEKNNTRIKSYALGAGPDLAITRVTLNPIRPKPNSAFTATITVTNQGATRSPQTPLAIWLHQSGAPKCGKTGDYTTMIDPIDPGQSTHASLNLHTSKETGKKLLQIFVDPACALPESNEEKNQTNLSYQVR
jgi:subtilase family serine protease